VNETSRSETSKGRNVTLCLGSGLVVDNLYDITGYTVYLYLSEVIRDSLSIEQRLAAGRNNQSVSPWNA